jgi:hypothetical protein
MTEKVQQAVASIEATIERLSKEKQECLDAYQRQAPCSDSMAMQNMMIGMHIKYLKELKNILS